MLSPEYLDSLPARLVRLIAQAESDTLTDMARRLKTYDYYIPAAQHQHAKLQELGLLHEEITKRLSKLTKLSEKEIDRLLVDAGGEALKNDDAVYRKAGLDPPPITVSETLLGVLNSGARQTKGTFRNITATTANTATGQFEAALDRAWMQIRTGAFDANAAIRFVVKGLSRQGMGAIRYPSGHVDTLEVAARRAVVTGANQTAAKLQLARAEELGCALVEVSAHGGARPEHAVWQGKVFSLSGRSEEYPPFSETGYGTGAGLCGWNCRHSFSPYFDGSPRTYSPELLAELERKKFSYNGQLLNESEARAQQRYIERQIRRWKRENVAMNAAGLDTGESAAKIAQWQRAQADFLKQTGLKRQIDRERISAATGVAKAVKSDIIEAQDVSRVGIDIAIDKFTPCLIERASGRVVETAYSAAPKQELTGLQKQGWLFRWNAGDLKGATIYKLTRKNESIPQGLIAIRDYRADSAVYVQLAESAPWNKGENKRYEGVGGHLFAVAAQKSMDWGYGGFLFLDAKNMELVEHYRKAFGAVHIGGPHPYRMLIDEDAARQLLNAYTLEEGS